MSGKDDVREGSSMKVAVFGAGGRMGREVCLAVASQDDMELVCAVDPAYAGRLLRDIVPGLHTDLVIASSPEEADLEGIQAAVDFTVAPEARKNVAYCLERGIHCVVGTTGLVPEDLEMFDRLAGERGLGCIVAPNFSVGAVLLMELCRVVARFMDSCEIIELHHPGKKDAPSGTALSTASKILQEWNRAPEESLEGPRGMNRGGIHLHSVRLPGLVAHQEVIFGGQGQTLTLRHDSYDRTSFMPGVLLALRKVSQVKGLLLGIEKLMGF
jgi:4-hydroxy-tetrahydrodipicolinate reductase